jgi:hypothetical protein
MGWLGKLYKSLFFSMKDVKRLLHSYYDESWRDIRALQKEVDRINNSIAATTAALGALQLSVYRHASQMTECNKALSQLLAQVSKMEYTEIKKPVKPKRH